MELRKNDIIDYYDDRRIVCGLVLEVDDKRLRILTDQGKEANLSLSRTLIGNRDPEFPAHGSRSDQVTRLKALSLERDRIKGEIDLRSLWEIVGPETAEICLKDLVDLFFGNQRDVNSAAALLRAIHDDRLYFRIRRDVIEVPTPERVEQALVQRERERDRITFMSRCAEFLSRLKNGEVQGLASAPEGLVSLLEEGARARQEWVDHKPLKEIFSRAGVPTGWDPFRVLVKLGVWSEDENVTLRTEEIPVDFSEEAENEARLVSSRPLPDHAVDLTAEEVITIDSVYTRDVDDGLSLRTDGDDFIVGIHITDVAHFVERDSALDQEIRERATSIYLADLTIPMMPPVLSEEAASLSVNENRLAMSVLVRIGADLRVKEYQIVSSVVRVKERLSYEDADERISTGQFRETTLCRIATALRIQRIAGGAIIFRDPELSVRVSAEGVIEVALRERESPSQVLVSELMILANRVFAQFVADRKIAAIFRSQPPPLEAIKLGEEYDPVLSYRAKRALSRGDIGTDPGPHSTLGLTAYTTATSPLRRYCDLLVQRQLKSAILDGIPRFEKQELDRIVSEISFRLERATMMERERQRYFLLKYLEQRRHEEFETIVLQRFPRFYLAQLTQFCLNTILIVPGNVTLNPGDRAFVRIDKISPRDDKLSLALVRLC